MQEDYLDGWGDRYLDWVSARADRPKFATHYSRRNSADGSMEIRWFCDSSRYNLARANLRKDNLHPISRKFSIWWQYDKKRTCWVFVGHRLPERMLPVFP